MSDIERFMPVVVRLDITEGPSKSFATRMNPHSTGPWVRYEDYAELERQLAEKERALHAYKSRDGECPSWLRPAVTDDVTDNMFRAGSDALFEHLDEVEDVGRDAITAIYNAMRRAAMEAENE